MEITEKNMPPNLKIREGEVILRKGSGKEERISKVLIIVKRRKKYVNHITNTVKKTVILQYIGLDGVSLWGEQEFEEKDIMNGKFIKERPIEIQIYNVRSGTKVFQEIIQVQIADLPIETIERFPFGWYEKFFHWLEDGREEISKEQEYGVVIREADMLRRGHSAITALVLAAVNGPMMKVLADAGIQHNFITFLSGPTGIGKTALAKKICGYLQHKNVIWALSSERKELKKEIQNISDVTIVVDDFNTSASDRYISKQLQTVSEIIQEACDAGGVILDEKSMDKMNHCVHTVVTSETVIRNVSTMNRCYLVDMQEKLPDDLWRNVSEMDERHDFAIFVRSFIRYIGENYDMSVSNCREDFSYYKQYARQQMLSEGTSTNRIVETMAVQFTLKKQMMNYMKTIGIDEKLWKRVDEAMNICIICSGQELQQKVSEIIVKKSRMELLPALADIIISNGQGYEMAASEKEYKMKIRYGERCIGFPKNCGYVSFKPSYMCQMIADYLGKEAVAVNCLGKELSYYNLAYVDGSEHKQSCRWHTNEKYYHVNYRQLIELVYGGIIDMEGIEGVINRIDENY